MVDGEDVMFEVYVMFVKIEVFIVLVYSGEYKGYIGKFIKYIVVIGIGGLFFGFKIMIEVFKLYIVDVVKVYFVVNVDGCYIYDVLFSVDFEEILVVMLLKLFFI